MTENFKTSEAQQLFGGRFIKVPFNGSMFKEVDENLRRGLSGHSVRYVIRSLDKYRINTPKDEWYQVEGEFPTYLYDRNPFNDVSYTLSRDILWGQCWPMLRSRREGQPGGINSFDQYANWNNMFVFSRESALSSLEPWAPDVSQQPLLDEDRRVIRENLLQNVTATADLYPDTEFYCFLPPYSIVYWSNLIQDGEMDRELETMEIAAEQLLQHPNIKLFCFDLCTELTTDLNNYKDSIHYSEDINSWMLQQMAQGNYLLTEENYQTVFREIRDYYSSYDYSALVQEAS